MLIQCKKFGTHHDLFLFHVISQVPSWFKKLNRAAPHALDLQNRDLEKPEFHNGLLIVSLTSTADRSCCLVFNSVDRQLCLASVLFLLQLS